MNEPRHDGDALEDIVNPDANDASPPRERARQRAYRDFMAPGDAPEAARVAEAEAELLNVLEREIGVSPGEDAGLPSAPSGAGTVGGPRTGSPVRARGSGRLRSVLLPGRYRPALALAALIVVAGAAWLIVGPPREGEAPLMRGQAPSVADGGLVTAPAPERLADGAVRLAWSGSAEAEAYAIVFYSADLEEIARVQDLPEPHFDLAPGALPAGLHSGDRVLWRALALRGTDEVARSQAQPISIP